MPAADRNDPFEHLKLYLEELETRKKNDILKKLNTFLGTGYKDLDSIPRDELLRMINRIKLK